MQKDSSVAMDSLVNQFLIAMPMLDDSYFGRTLIYMCEHDQEGAMGLVVNREADITIKQVLSELDLETETPETEKKVLIGGPVQTDRGFVLHNDSQKWSSSLNLSEQITVTTSKDILNSIGNDQGPNKYLMALGYSGWSAGQLEQEIADNTWLTVNADPQLIFDTPIEKRWEKALEVLGISIEQLSTVAGHA
jgi:putative transcriptional regulator